MAGLLLFFLLGGMMEAGQAAIVIRRVADPTPQNWLGTGPIQFTEPVCIRWNTQGTTASTTQYTVTATGTGGGGAFYLQGPSPLSNDVIQYAVQWGDSATSITGVALTAGVTSSAFTPNPYLTPNPSPQIPCNSDNATAIVIIPESELQNAPAGDYSGTLFMTVAPL
ncbi:MAG: hypothetical protein LJE73_09695 [Proteobacteria bacterium]|nr:hypothetical protein [Pseudomonadota bacterium]